MTPERSKRVAAALKQEISRIIHYELKDPRIGFVTVTKVNLAQDFKSATVYFSILGDEKEKKKTLIGLKRATGYIRKLIGERIELRYTPEIIFCIDKTSEYVRHIQEIIEKIHDQDRDNNSDNSDD